MKIKAILLIAALATIFVSVIASLRCAATTRDGSQCKRAATPGSIYCWQHRK